jgi:choline dehydrogenase
MAARRTADYVIVGAGSAGCVLANRLSAANHSVVLLEAGPRDNSIILRMPAALGLPLLNTRFNWAFQSEPEPGLGGRRSDQPRGRVLGGSSSLNGMVFVRGNARDYDGWVEAGAPSWSYAECLPYFKRMETFSGGADAYRGGDGPLHVTRCRAENPLYEAFLAAGQDAGLPLTDDHNGRDQEGVNIAQATVHRGVRESTSRAFLAPISGRANLSVVTGAVATGVILSGNRAVGVACLVNGEERQFEAEREVILSAGSFGSPHLLMLSGIGDTAELREHGITARQHLPGVGKNLQDHVAVPIQYRSTKPVSPARNLGKLGRLAVGLQWMAARSGLGASNYFEVGAFMRGNDQVAWPNLQHEFFPMIGEFYRGEAKVEQGFQYFLSVMRPESRGAVTLASRDPKAAPRIRFNFLTESTDCKQMIEGIRLTRNIIRQRGWDELRGAEVSPGNDVQSDRELEGWIRVNAGTGYHAAGTCRMGQDAQAVTDEEGRVHGVAALRVADASLMPRLVTGNTNAVSIMIGEKLSDRILGRSLPPAQVGQ